VRKSDLTTALSLAKKLYRKLADFRECSVCGGTGGECPFSDQICLDVDTIINNLESVIEEKEAGK
jgi:hypothetical protein